MIGEPGTTDRHTGSTPGDGTPSRRRKRDRGLAAIAIFKFAKATLLVVVGLGALALLHPAVSRAAHHWLAVVSSGTDRAITLDIIARVSGVRPTQLEALGIGAFLYAALFITEGVGLWKGLRWAEYLTVIATASFIPFEVHELVRRVSPTRITALIVNVVVVIYLIYMIRRPSAKPPSAGSRME